MVILVSVTLVDGLLCYRNIERMEVIKIDKFN